PVGVLTNYIDYTVYFSYIAQVKAGHYLLANLFTSELQTVFVFNPLWLFIGLCARFFHLAPEVAFHLARLVFTPLLFFALYKFIKLFFKEERMAQWCLA